MVKSSCSRVIALNYLWHPTILGKAKQKQIKAVTSRKKLQNISSKFWKKPDENWRSNFHTRVHGVLRQQIKVGRRRPGLILGDAEQQRGWAVSAWADTAGRAGEKLKAAKTRGCCRASGHPLNFHKELSLEADAGQRASTTPDLCCSDIDSNHRCPKREAGGHFCQGPRKQHQIQSRASATQRWHMQEVNCQLRFCGSSLTILE